MGFLKRLEMIKNKNSIGCPTAGADTKGGALVVLFLRSIYIQVPGLNFRRTIIALVSKTIGTREYR